MDAITEEIVKKKINDGNGGNGYLFWQLFIRLDDLAKKVCDLNLEQKKCRKEFDKKYSFKQEKYQIDIDKKIEALRKIICPIQKENQNRKIVTASVKKFRLSLSSWIALIILVINFYLLIKGGI